MDRRLVYFGGAIIALVVLSLMGMTPQVLYQRAQEMVANAGGAAAKARHLSNERQNRAGEATSILDDLPGQKKKDSWTDRN